MSTLPRPLIQSLEMLAATAEALELRNGWLIFGGAAMALSGLPDWPVPDIDVLVSSEETANDLIEAFGGQIITPKTQDRFRSRLLARIDTTPVPIEIMVGLEVKTDDGWAPVAFRTRVDRPVQDRHIPTARTAEQAAMARRFGRPKDLQRAEALDKLTD
ncbi:hypothetical protein [Brevundimonas sp. GCM10030266]|uniref:hypothetical protein n=1 Tax=Brevundimonas sp. GCM10030266 TaxID=3273386 RepID=UPI00360AA908